MNWPTGTIPKSCGQTSFCILTRRTCRSSGSGLLPSATASGKTTATSYNVAHKCYYIAFNDYLFKIDAKGNLVNYYHFNAKREVEGLASYKSKIYIAMNKRAEVFDSNMAKQPQEQALKK